MYFAQGNDAMFLACLMDLSEEIPESYGNYSMVLTALGGRQCVLGATDEAVSNLAKAALRDVRAGDRHGTALIRLGVALYDAGDLARAHNYLSVALE